MTQFSEGDYVKYRSGGILITKKVLDVRPNGNLVTGDHDKDPDNHIINPEARDINKVRQ